MNKKQIIKCLVDEEGKIQNSINWIELINQSEINNNPIDLYFCFILKTLIDDFGYTLEKSSKINKEQFEAQFIENLISFLNIKTIDEPKDEV